MLGWRNLAWNQGPEGYSSHGDTHTCLSVPKVVSWKKGTSAGRLEIQVAMGLCLPTGPQVPCHGVLVCVCMSGFFFFF
jgi:hypothetical protein